MRGLHPEINCEYHGAGAGGIDILGFAADGTKKLIAEVKTTHTSDMVGLRGPQKNAIERDLKRLSEEPGDFTRHLIVISAQTKNAVEKQLRPEEKYPTVTVIDAIGLVHSPPEAAIDDE